MSMESGLNKVLLADATVQALISGRVYGANIPSTLSDYPCVSFELAAGPIDYTHDGERPDRTWTYRIVAWDDDYLNTIVLAEAILAAFPPTGGVYDDQTVNRIFCTSMRDTAFNREDVNLYVVGREMMFEIHHQAT